LQYIRGVQELGEADGALLPSVSFSKCPIRVSAGVFGKKWTLLILRDIGMRHIQRFNRLLESVRGINPRVLSQRLKELEEEGLIERVEERSPILVRWALTEKGEDALPILMSFIAFGSKWYASECFADKKPRTLRDLFPSPVAREVVERYSRG
jgi:DNA-binding HxlR family transcriptional regulator